MKCLNYRISINKKWAKTKTIKNCKTKSTNINDSVYEWFCTTCAKIFQPVDSNKILQISKQLEVEHFKISNVD